MLLTLALALEFAASLLAFNQAVQAGALRGEVNCGPGGRLERLDRSERLQDKCMKMDASVAEGIMSSSLDFLNVGCEPTEAPTGDNSFLAQCSCPEDGSTFWSASSQTEGCIWIGVELQVSSTSSGLDDEVRDLCLAKAFYLTDSPDDGSTDTSGMLFTEGDDGLFATDGDDRLFLTSDCWAKNPAGTATITIAAFVVAVVGQLVEGFVSWRYFKDPEKGPALMTAGSVLEAAGAVAVSVTLINLPCTDCSGEGQAWVQDGLHTDQEALYGLAVMAATCAGLGALADIVAGYLKFLERDSRSSWDTRLFCMLHDDRTRKHRIYYLSAFGSAAIWLGTAVVELVVATFLVWKGEGKARLRIDEGDWGVFGTSLVALLVTEVVALFFTWAARFLWTRAKLLMLVELDIPVSRFSKQG